ncbi:MAG: hypothetical protein IPP43_06820 [Chitinophagaceae bacterium]|nr:hypothetical protein [Chitinophagaceae bacterium]MBL0130857.1 hypothetical protein [Chitinophagaceae bacterium]MBL0274470.1 hypothetical protein [Chitinophagaceae bacterium]
MEVHAHTHTPRKKWIHYLWDFLMLFLAVFCGFLAEYQLEHKIEKDREKVYMQNLLEDLKTDTAIYSKFKKNNVGIYALIDSLTFNMKLPNRKNHINKLYLWSRKISIELNFLFPVERTYEQMKSSGHLRLISKREVADSVSYYYNSLKGLYKYNDVGLEWTSDYVRSVGKIFDAGIHLKILKERKEQDAEAIGLLTENPVLINEMLSSAQYIYGALKLSENAGTQRMQTAQNLINLIKKEYHIE